LQCKSYDFLTQRYMLIIYKNDMQTVVYMNAKLARTTIYVSGLAPDTIYYARVASVNPGEVDPGPLSPFKGGKT